MGQPKSHCNRRPYHHGDLRQTLVEAAERLLEEHGGAGVSLREVCQCAGVSHAAPYRHFRDKAALMEAVAQAGFDQLGRMIAAARKGHPDDPVRQLRDAGVAYVLWATENPERTLLMFSGMMKAEQIPPGLHASAEAAFEQIYRIIDDGRKGAVFAGASTNDIVLACWAAVHGLTMLILGSGKLNPDGESEIRALAHSVCDTILSGIQVRVEANPK